jgi:hypothetical protein
MRNYHIAWWNLKNLFDEEPRWLDSQALMTDRGLSANSRMCERHS